MKQLIGIVLLATVASIGCSHVTDPQGGRFRNKCYEDVAWFTSKSMTVIEEAKGSDRDRRLTDLRTEYANKMDPTTFKALKEAMEAWGIFYDTLDNRYLDQSVRAQERALEACKQHK
jgi:hypothetical protein